MACTRCGNRNWEKNPFPICNDCEPCPTCKGNGADPDGTACPACKGRGWVRKE